MMRYGLVQFGERSNEFSGLCRGFMSGSFGWGGMLVGGLIFLGVIVLAVLLIAALIRHGKSNHQHGYPVPPVNPNAPGAQNTTAAAALAILNDRYAKGEIGQEEYLSKKADLLK